MRKKLFLTALLGAVFQVNAQTTIFNETFEANSSTLGGWTLADRDGDSVNWIFDDQDAAITDPMGFSGNIYFSGSFNSTPDNLLISPLLNMPSGGSLSLSFQIASFSSSTPAEHYAVYVLPSTAVFTGNETPVFEETLSNIQAETATTRTVDISSSAGQSIKVYFRHYDTDSQYAVLLDNVKITQNTLGTVEADYSKIGIYPNPVADILNIRSKSKINEIQIFDMNGRKINVDLNNDKVNVRSLQSGNYVITIETGEGKITQKFIKK